jgi:membrane protease YdiL (CAAX protease family)
VRNNSTWVPSALSPTAWPPKAWNVPLTLLGLFGALLAALVPAQVYLIVASVRGILDPVHPSTWPPDQVLAAQVITYLPLGIYLVCVIPALARTSLHDLGLRRPAASEIGLGLGGALVMLVVVSLSGALVEHLSKHHDVETAVALLKQMHTVAEKIVFFAIAVILAPMIEELLFRVFLFNALTSFFRRFERGATPAAAILSGIVFGAVHTTSISGLITISIPLALGGVVLAYVYASTRCYWASVTTHAAFNGVQVLALFLFHIQ